MLKRFRLHTTTAEKKALLSTLNSGGWVIGADLEVMESNLKNLFKRKYAVLTSNGFSALFIAIKTVGIKNKKIGLPEISSCFAIVNAIIASGNVPYFLPVNYSTGNIDLDAIDFEKEKIKYIIFPNHNGITTDFKEVKKKDLFVIEDCAQSFLSSSKKKSLADIQVFSFYPTKTFNGIDSGAILTDNRVVYNTAKEKVYYNAQKKYDGVERYNYRLPNIHAAVFNANIARYTAVMQKIQRIKKSYDTALSKKMSVQHGIVSSDVLYKYILLCQDEKQKGKLMKLAKQHNIQLSTVYINTSNKKLSPAAAKLVNLTIQLPFFEDLTGREIKQVTGFLKVI